MLIFFIRLITATCFYALLGKANIWLNPWSNAILAIGYRFFLLLSPAFARYTKKYSVTVCLLLSSVGIFLFCFHSNWIFILGALLLSLGMSVSSYLIRSESSETPSGAAHNKIAANVGSILAGLILLASFDSKVVFFQLGALALFITCLIALATAHKQKPIKLLLPKNLNLQRSIGWGLLGIAVGIKLIGVFSVLPQFLLSNDGKLPSWYGAMIFANGMVIILLQLPIIHLIEKYKLNNNGLKATLLIMMLGMLLIAFPIFLHVNIFFGALLWTISLSLVECIASYLDVHGSRSGYLLIKETAVGIGCGFTIIMSRCLPTAFSSIVIGCVGAGCIIAGYLLLRKDFKVSMTSKS